MSLSTILNFLSGDDKNQFNSQDLYQVDHRKFTMEHCDAKAAARRQALEATKRKSGLISNLEKLAGIEGTGVVQEALDAIVSATHVGGSEWEGIVNRGANGILTSVLGDQAVNVINGTLDKINPHGVNTAITSAKQIHQKVKDRDFDWKDIPQYVADFKNLYGLGKTVLDPFFENNAPNTSPVVACSASPYAQDLIRIGAKFKFLFIVEFEFHHYYQQLGNVNPAFVVKTVDRPSLSYEYEDVNMYNFRTKVLKRSTFNPLNLAFYDDEQNHALAFYNAMLRLMTPLANHGRPDFFEETGMDFEDLVDMDKGKDSGTQGITSYIHAASIGPTLGDATSIIKNIKIHHVYMGGQKVNTYIFHRPRITQMSLDGLDMTDGEVTNVNFEFAYDAIDIINNDVDALQYGSLERDREFILNPLGGRNASINVPAASIVPGGGTKASGSIAEAYARGEGFVEGAIAKGKNMANNVMSSVKGIFS